MYSENLDFELEKMESTGETEAEWIDQQTELEDAEGQMDEIMGPDAAESDVENAFASFMTDNEMDYNGWDDSRIDETIDLQHSSDVLESKPDAFHLVDRHDWEGEEIDMEVEDGDIQDYLLDDDGNEIGFVLLDDNGNPQNYYYVIDDDGSTIDAEGDKPAHVVRESDGEEFTLGLSMDEI